MPRRREAAGGTESPQRGAAGAVAEAVAGEEEASRRRPAVQLHRRPRPCCEPTRNGPDTCSVVPSPRRARNCCAFPPCAWMKRPLLTCGPSEENARGAVVHPGQDEVNRKSDRSRRSLPLAKEAEQELEHVDEVQVQAQRTED